MPEENHPSLNTAHRFAKRKSIATGYKKQLWQKGRKTVLSDNLTTLFLFCSRSTLEQGFANSKNMEYALGVIRVGAAFF